MIHAAVSPIIVYAENSLGEPPWNRMTARNNWFLAACISRSGWIPMDTERSTAINMMNTNAAHWYVCNLSMVFVGKAAFAYEQPADPEAVTDYQTF
jgi:hypothetical protein